MNSNATCNATCTAHFSIQEFVHFTPQLSSRMSLLEDFAKAIEIGDSNQIESLLASGSIDVNARLPREFNPPPLVLAVTCEARRVDTLCIVEMLLSAGAHIECVDDENARLWR
jgi:hypothetical protein